MAQLNDTEELRQSLEKILELSLKLAQRLSTVLEGCRTQMTDEDEREIGQRKSTVAGRTGRAQIRVERGLDKSRSASDRHNIVSAGPSVAASYCGILRNIPADT